MYRPTSILWCKWELLISMFDVAYDADPERRMTLYYPDSMSIYRKEHRELHELFNKEYMKIALRENQATLDRVFPMDIASLIVVYAYGHRNLHKNRYVVHLPVHVVEMRVQSQEICNAKAKEKRAADHAKQQN